MRVCVLHVCLMNCVHVLHVCLMNCVYVLHVCLMYCVCVLHVCLMNCVYVLHVCLMYCVYVFHVCLMYCVCVLHVSLNVLCAYVIQSNVIKELEGRVQQLMMETENVKKAKTSLEKEKLDADTHGERLKSELRKHQDK